MNIKNPPLKYFSNTVQDNVSDNKLTHLHNLGIYIPLILTVMMLVLSTVEMNCPSVFLFFLLTGILSIIILHFTDKTAMHIFSIVYGVSCTAALILYYIYIYRFGTPYLGGGSDDLSYEALANILANNTLKYDAEEIKWLIDNPFHNSMGYIYLVSLIIRFGDFIGGFHTMMPRILNCTLLGFISVLVYSISKRIGLTLNQSKVAALWTGLFPIMIFTAIHTFRDILLVFFFLLAVQFALKIQDSNNLLKSLALSMIILIFMPIFFSMRYYYAIPLISILFFSWFSKMWRKTTLSNWSIILLCIVLVLTLNYTVKQEIFMANKLERFLTSYQSSLSIGGIRGWGLSTNLFSLPPPLNYVAQLAYALVTPLPILYDDIEWNILSLGTLAQFIFAPFVLLGIVASYRQVALLPILAPFLIIFFGYVYGTFVFRHITTFIPFAVIYGVFGYTSFKQYRSYIWIICFFVLLLAATFYIYLKYL